MAETLVAKGALASANDAVTLGVAGMGGIAIQVTSTFVGTVAFEGTLDGFNWRALLVTPTNSTTQVTTATGVGLWTATITGVLEVRVRYSVVSSGSPFVVIRSALASPGGSSSGGGGGGGTSSTFGDPFPAAGTAAGFIDASGNMAGATLSAAGNLKVDVAEGGSGSNAAAGPTGSAVPADADYLGVLDPSSSNNLTGVQAVKLDADTGAGTQAVTTFPMGMAGNGGLVMAVGGTGVDSPSVQRISLATNVPLPAGTNVLGHVVTDTGSTTAVTGTVAISAASLPLPTGASTAAKQPALGTAGAASADVITVQGVASMTPLAVTAAQATGSNLHTVVDSGTITTVSTVTAVTAISNALPAGTNLLGKVGIDQTTLGTTNGVTPVPSVLGGWTYSLKNGLSNTNSQVKSGQATLGGYYIYNPNSSVAYVQIYDTATGSITVGTTTPKLSVGIPATSAANLDSTCGIQFGTAICVAATTTVTGASAPATALDCNFWYK